MRRRAILQIEARGKPPSTVTHRIAGRQARFCPVGTRRSWARNPRSMIARSVLRLSAARRFAAMKRSSGNSIVVFIWVYTLPYLWATA